MPREKRGALLDAAKCNLFQCSLNSTPLMMNSESSVAIVTTMITRMSIPSSFLGLFLLLVPPPPCMLLDAEGSPADWELWEFSAAAAAAAAVAIVINNPKIRLRKWRDDNEDDDDDETLLIGLLSFLFLS